MAVIINDKKINKWSVSDLKAALEFCDEQAKFWENISTDPDPEKEQENQENYNCWTNRGEIIEDELFSRFDDVFYSFTADLK